MRLSAALALWVCAGWGQGPPIRGFPAAAVEGQLALESRLRAIPEPGRAREYVRRMASRPHPAGSAESKAVAEWAAGLLRSWGYDARVERFDALLPYPRAHLVEMTSPVVWRATLVEPAVAGEEAPPETVLPAFNAYSGAGDVMAPLVYAGYGASSDYEDLARRKVDVRGKVVLVRYGRVWRGTKPLLAQQHGAVACLLYSDPADDGAGQGDVHPKGPWRPATSFQRGSVLDMPRQLGDPSTPGWASEAGARRLPLEEAPGILKIPVVPLSAEDGAALLRNLAGPAVVRVRTEFDWAVRPLYNVMARMRGSDEPDRWVMYGNHHDAWVYGAADPASGVAALLETARAIGELARRGFRPRRTLVFALWDGEEFGLIGSTEWVEKHRGTVREKVVAYLNSDSNTPGPLQVSGSPLLETFFGEAAGERGLRVTPPGAGSDYVAFAHHAGVAAVNAGFGSAAAMGTYHSIHDAVGWFESRMDREYVYARRLAQVMGVAMLRLSESRVLPFSFGPVERVLREHAQSRAVAAELDALAEASRRYETVLAGLGDRGSRWGEWNRLLVASERTLTDERGLEGRPWYKHLLWAPGLDVGYAAELFPAGARGRGAAAITALRRHVERVVAAAGR